MTRPWQRLTLSGRAVMLALILSGVVMHPASNRIHFLFGASAGLLMGTLLCAWWGRPGLRVQRLVPERVTAGRPFRYRLLIENPSARAARDLWITEPSPWLRAPRGLGWITCLPARSQTRLDLEALATQRGTFVLPGPAVVSVFPFGLLGWGAVPSQPARVVALPLPTPVRHLELPLGARHQPGGIPLASAVGESGEFVGTRLFRSGDSPRRIHWRSWARVGYPVVKEYQEEYFSRVALILDTQSAEATPVPWWRRVPAAPRRGGPVPPPASPFEAAVSLCAGVVEFFGREELIIDLLAVGPQVFHVSAGRSLAALDDILEILSCVAPSRHGSLEALEAHMATFMDEVGAAVVVLLDLDASRAALLRSLRGHGLAVRGLVVTETPPIIPDDLVYCVRTLTPAELADGVDVR